MLYAPTWEGWGDEPYHSSLPFEGVELVRRLLATPGRAAALPPAPAHRHPQQRGPAGPPGGPGPAACRGGPGVPAPCRRPRRPGRRRSRRRLRGLDDLALMAARSEPVAGRPSAARARRLAEEAFWSCHRTGGAPRRRGRLAGPGQLLRPHRPADRRRLQRRLRLGRPRPPLRAGRRRRAWAARSSSGATPAAAAGGCWAPARAGLDALVADLLQGSDPDAAHARPHPAAPAGVLPR